jgi:hypothetical protein
MRLRQARLIGAVLLEQNDEWLLQHRYMQIEVMAELTRPLIDTDPAKLHPWQPDCWRPQTPPDLHLIDGRDRRRSHGVPRPGRHRMRWARLDVRSPVTQHPYLSLSRDCGPGACLRAALGVPRMPVARTCREGRDPPAVCVRHPHLPCAFDLG